MAVGPMRSGDQVYCGGGGKESMLPTRRDGHESRRNLTLMSEGSILNYMDQHRIENLMVYA